MIREIENVFTDFPDYGCFACDPSNKLGLRMKFYADDDKDEVFVKINLQSHFAGFPGILHGGIQCALMDEVAFWAMFDKLKKIGLTAKIEIDYQNKVETLKEIEIRGKIGEIKNRRVMVDVKILNDDKKVTASSQVTYLIPNRSTLYKLMGKERFSKKFQQYIQD
jgi:acyl-coenzyme A thioesterase PaaI-like protein